MNVHSEMHRLQAHTRIFLYAGKFVMCFRANSSTQLILHVFSHIHPAKEKKKLVHEFEQNFTIVTQSYCLIMFLTVFCIVLLMIFSFF